LDLIESGYFSKDGVDDAQAVVHGGSRARGSRSSCSPISPPIRPLKAEWTICTAPDEWSRKASLNCLNMGYFSSDRSVREYADRIWNVRPVI
jgi:glucan phosphorylase